MELSILEAAEAATERLGRALGIKSEHQFDNDLLQGYNKGYTHGAEWQKEQDKELINLMRQLLGAYDIRYPDTLQLLVGYTNEQAFEKLNHLIENRQS